MAYKSTTFQTRKTLDDFPNLNALKSKYGKHNPPIGEYKEALLADGYSQAVVDKIKYQTDTSDTIEKVFNKKQWKETQERIKSLQRAKEEHVEEIAEDNLVDNENDDIKSIASDFEEDEEDDESDNEED